MKKVLRTALLLAIVVFAIVVFDARVTYGRIGYSVIWGLYNIGVIPLSAL